ncbi:MAG: sensor histidine kinase [Ignavibacteriales bacterium]
MRSNSIQKKIVASLMAVALLATLATVGAGIYTARQLFSNYLTQKASSQAEMWATTFSTYYLENGSFEGINNALYSNGRGRGNGMMRGMGSNRVMLVSLDNRVLYDSAGRLVGQTMTADLIEDGTPVYVNSDQVGTALVPISGMLGINSLEASFIDSFTLYSAFIGLIAALVALMLGMAMVRPISDSIHTISEATHRLAHGDLDTRVPVQGEGEIRRLTEDFNAMADVLRNNETMRRNLTADVAHELRTPLAVLRANLESLQSGVAKPDPSTIASLQDEVIRISRLVKDMEVLSLAETGNLVLHRKPTHFHEVIDRLAPVMMDIEARNLKLDAAIDENLPLLSIDIDRTVQVMLNLLSNAIAHSPAEGKIMVKGEKIDSKLRVSVADQGIGISPEQIPYVFERFYRADSARTRSEGGMGLGLAIAKSFVTSQGGTIWVESSPGSGSIFYFTLPLA